jgi:cytochrome c-type biogenesis protein CcmH/NrfG
VPLVARVFSDPEWILVMQEPSAMMFVRQGAVSAPQRVAALDKNLIWRQVMQKSRRMMAENPGKAEGYLSMAEAALMLNELSTAADYYGRYLQLRPGDRDAASVLSMIRSGTFGTTR